MWPSSWQPCYCFKQIVLWARFWAVTQQRMRGWGVKQEEWQSIVSWVVVPASPLGQVCLRSCPGAAAASALKALPALLHLCSCAIVTLWQHRCAVYGCIYWPYAISVLGAFSLGSLQTFCSSCALLERWAGAAVITRLWLYAGPELFLQPVHKVIPKTISAILGTVKPASIGQQISHQLDLLDFGPNKLFLDSACTMRVCIFNTQGIKLFKIS